MTKFMSLTLTMTFMFALRLHYGYLCGKFEIDNDPKGRRDPLYDVKGHGDLCGRFDLLYGPKRSRGH